MLFRSDKCTVAEDTLCGGAATSFDEVLTRNALMRSYFDLIGHSVPLFMALGNHDGESGTTTAGAQALSTWSLAARKHFYANPEPDDFYRGNTTLSPDQGFRQNYYAFEWGDALFVVLDPYTYAVRKPRRGVDRDGWTWTLGETQYRWLVETLAGSEARYKFVFSHHLLGGNGSEARGGAAFGSFFEWGGQDLDGTWAFDRERPGWGRPIRQLFSDYRVTAWFHGHDHFYAREQLDGTIYQEVPQPSLDRYDMPNPAAGYGYLGAMGENQFASSGHLRVTVSPTAVQVDYVRSVAPGDEVGTRRNRAILQSYTIR